MLRLYLGDSDGYRQIRDRMTSRFYGTYKDEFALEWVRASALADDPQAPGAAAAMVRLASRAVGTRPEAWYPLYVCALAHYRGGQYEQAVSRLTETLNATPEVKARDLARSVLAMAYHRLGRPDDARAALSAAAAARDEWLQSRYDGPGGTRWVL